MSIKFKNGSEIHTIESNNIIRSNAHVCMSKKIYDELLKCREMFDEKLLMRNTQKKSASCIAKISEAKNSFISSQ